MRSPRQIQGGGQAAVHAGEEEEAELLSVGLRSGRYVEKHVCHEGLLPMQAHQVARDRRAPYCHARSVQPNKMSLEYRFHNNTLDARYPWFRPRPLPRHRTPYASARRLPQSRSSSASPGTAPWTPCATIGTACPRSSTSSKSQSAGILGCMGGLLICHYLWRARGSSGVNKRKSRIKTRFCAVVRGGDRRERICRCGEWC